MKNPTPQPKSHVTIPHSELGARLDEAARLKRDMAALLQELEDTAAGHPVAKTGAWRHHPASWRT